ncbi:HTH-type transcriptional regulator SinR [Aquicella siphonis]|uniref:HTH-type transcriptional regulator SinR n=1 Tax=Aquicella siphonis TaxID=254247 RepID=A0A5E4PH69_9COXI|nr:helix-turn-helix transcriptional regulator [Aquicella siphonis]VVC75723.1 HTH-type transcriptional regulator SinR [Aquicella siphonis]
MPKNQSNYKQLFSHNLRRLRESKNISQENLANLAGLHRTYVSSVERGERNISIDSMEKLANALNVDIRELLDPKLLKE